MLLYLEAIFCSMEPGSTWLTIRSLYTAALDKQKEHHSKNSLRYYFLWDVEDLSRWTAIWVSVSFDLYHNRKFLLLHPDCFLACYTSRTHCFLGDFVSHQQAMILEKSACFLLLKKQCFIWECAVCEKMQSYWFWCQTHWKSFKVNENSQWQAFCM